MGFLLTKSRRRCPYCEAVFRYKYNYLIHIKRQHKEIYNLKKEEKRDGFRDK